MKQGQGWAVVMAAHHLLRLVYIAMLQSLAAEAVARAVTLLLIGARQCDASWGSWACRSHHDYTGVNN